MIDDPEADALRDRPMRAPGSWRNKEYVVHASAYLLLFILVLIFRFRMRLRQG